MITKDDIKRAIEKVFRVTFNQVNKPNILFDGYQTFHHRKNVCHPLINNAINGGYETDFYTQVGDALKTLMIGTSVEVVEKKVRSDTNYDFYDKGELILRDMKKVDIIEVDTTSFDYPMWNNQHVVSGAEAAHNHMGQLANYITDHLLENIYCGLQVGIKNLLLMGIFDDFIPDGNDKKYFRGKKYEKDRVKRVGNDNLARETINHIRGFCRKIDLDFNHFILHNHIPGVTIYVHIFVVLVPIDLPVRFDKKNLRVVL
jgi:hypothetical protein